MVVAAPLWSRSLPYGNGECDLDAGETVLSTPWSPFPSLWSALGLLPTSARKEHLVGPAGLREELAVLSHRWERGTT